VEFVQLGAGSGTGRTFDHDWFRGNRQRRRVGLTHPGSLALSRTGPRLSAPASASGLNGSGEFGERGGDTAAGACFDPSS